MHRYRFLLSLQWVILTIVAIALIPTMIKLGFWQKHRYEERTARNDLVASALHAEPVPVERLSSPGHAVTRTEKYRTVTATGTFDTAKTEVGGGRAHPHRPVGDHGLNPVGQAPRHGVV
ncbi:SURF1 family cytochrome oxidase biogenesis protein, partial [Streptomyces murinus]|uniref:SURF1 family cytochrome oxidase biogenesis protein n=1 Tax=Streptomyces murinus TaxID=33900 RepID=UPI003F48225E